MILATGAKLRMLASDVPSFFLDLEARGDSGDREEGSWDMIGLLSRWHHKKTSGCAPSSMSGRMTVHARVADMSSRSDASHVDL
jgi:hypothetical protein